MKNKRIRYVNALILGFVLTFSFNTLNINANEATMNVNTEKDIKDVIPDANLRAAIAAAYRINVSRLDVEYLENNKDRLERIQNNDYSAENRIYDFTGIENFKNLKYLRINNRNDDGGKLNVDNYLSPLASNTKLEELYLSRNRVDDIKPLEGLIQLNTLSVPNNNIEDISPLASLTNLTIFEATNNKIKDLSPLKNSRSLIFMLFVNGNAIEDFSPIKDIYSNINSTRYRNQTINKIVDQEFNEKDFKYQVPIDIDGTRVDEIKDITPEGGVYDKESGYIVWNDLSKETVNGSFSFSSTNTDVNGKINLTINHLPEVINKEEITLKDSATVNAGAKVNLIKLFNVKALDSAGVDITNKVSVIGSYNLNKAGTYTIQFKANELLSKKVKLTVLGSKVVKKGNTTYYYTSINGKWVLNKTIQKYGANTRTKIYKLIRNKNLLMSDVTVTKYRNKNTVSNSLVNTYYANGNIKQKYSFKKNYKTSKFIVRNKTKFRTNKKKSSYIVLKYKKGKQSSRLEYSYNKLGQLRTNKNGKSYRYQTKYNKKGNATKTMRRKYNSKSKLGKQVKVSKRTGI